MDNKVDLDGQPDEVSQEDARVADLEQRLADAESTIQALIAGQVDAALVQGSKTPLLLHEAQEALRQSSMRLRLLLSQLPAIVWTTDREMVITSAAGAGLGSLGLVAEELVGTIVSETLATDADETLVAERHRQALEGRSVGYEVALAERALQVHVEPFRDAHGTITGCLAVALDITARKAAENVLLQAKADLEEKVELRTGSLTLANQELGKAGEELREQARRLVASQKALEWERQRYQALFQQAPDGYLVVDAKGMIQEANRAAAKRFAVREQFMTGKWLTIFLGQENSITFLKHIAVLQDNPDLQVSTWEASLRPRTKNPIDIEFTATPVRDANGNLVAVRCMLHDVTERNRTHQALLAVRNQLETLLTIAHNVASTLDLQRLLDITLDQLRVLVDYDSASVLMLRQGHLSVRAYRGAVPTDRVEGQEFRVRAGSSMAQVIESRQTVILADLQDGKGWASVYGEESMGLAELLSGTRSWMAAPLVAKGRVIGVLQLGHPEPATFTAEHGQLLQAIADQAAIALENARLYEGVHKLAALEERQRLARELHDSVAQALYGISLGVHSALATSMQDRARLDDALAYILSLADAGLTEIRALIFELRPEALEAEGLIEAIRKQAAAVQARRGILVETYLCEEPDVPLVAKEALYRVAQEALQNVVKHARATKASVQLIVGDSEITLEVTDDGVGFDPQLAFPGHLGLRSMRERVADVGGSLVIESTPGQGSCVRAEVPRRPQTMT